MEYDLKYTELFSSPILVNELITNYVKEPWVKDLYFDTLKKINTKFTDEAKNRRESDIIFSVKKFNGDEIFLYILLELQSKPHDWMALRFLVYSGLFYQDLIKQRQIKPKDGLPPVFPIVLYNGGRQWMAPENLKKHINLPKNSMLWKYQPQMSYFLLDEKAHLDDNINESSLLDLVFKMEHSKNVIELESYIGLLADRLNNYNAGEFKKLFLHWVEVTLNQKGMLSQKTQNLKEVKTMLAEQIDLWKEEIQKKSREEGHRDLIQKLIIKKYGPLFLSQISKKLENATQKDFDNFSEWIIDCQTANEFLEKLK